MSNFSFSHSVFKRLALQGRQKVSLCGNGLIIYLSSIETLICHKEIEVNWVYFFGFAENTLHNFQNTV